ncbi:hypothetical protein XENTR_v10006694 [Xenopus tropicalis]|nr:hypothetical protein XENTR_v10006694 [Xenopus tropicalis]
MHMEPGCEQHSFLCIESDTDFPLKHFVKKLNLGRVTRTIEYRGSWEILILLIFICTLAKDTVGLESECAADTKESTYKGTSALQWTLGFSEEEKD